MKLKPTYGSASRGCNAAFIARYFKIKPSKVVRFFLAFLPITLSIVSSPFNAQELVPDPGFEIQNCENSPELEYWFNPNLATPDLMNTEGCGAILNNDLYDVGFAEPYEGNGYVGLFCCYPVDSENQTREYISTELLATLDENVTYSVSFKIRRLPAYDLAIDRIGVFLSAQDPSYVSTLPMEVVPQLETSGELLANDSAWQSLSFSYTANGDETFLTLGCFRWPSEMLVEDINTGPKNYQNAYYFFDQISVQSITSIDSFEGEFGIIELINGELLITAYSPDIHYVEVFDPLGSTVLATTFIGSTTIDGDLLPSNLVLNISLSNKLNRKISKQFVFIH